MTFQQQQQLLILVVDDQSAVLDQVAAVVTQAGFACQCCSVADEAVALAASFAPDLIISATHFRGHNGLEICERIKLLPGLADVPVMFLSACQVPDIIRRHDAVGSTYHLRKPFDPNVLLELIENALRVPQCAERERP